MNIMCSGSNNSLQVEDVVFERHAQREKKCQTEMEPTHLQKQA